MGLMLLLERGRGRWQLFAWDEAAIVAANRRWNMTGCSAQGGSPCFSWDRVNFHPSRWCSAVFWI